MKPKAYICSFCGETVYQGERWVAGDNSKAHYVCLKDHFEKDGERLTPYDGNNFHSAAGTKHILETLVCIMVVRHSESFFQVEQRLQVYESAFEKLGWHDLDIKLLSDEGQKISSSVINHIY